MCRLSACDARHAKRKNLARTRLPVRLQQNVVLNHPIAVRKCMRFIFLLVCLLSAAVLSAQSTSTQTFSTSAGPVKITPLFHASTLIEAGGKTIYLDPAKPAKFDGHPKADLILITDIHGDHMDPASIAQVSQGGTEIMAPPAVVKTVTSAKPIPNGETKTWQ